MLLAIRNITHARVRFGLSVAFRRRRASRAGNRDPPRGARALVNDPALILADEPTANLDSAIGHEIMRIFRRIAKENGRAVVIVSHDQRIRDIADRVLWLEDGQFAEAVELAVDPVCGMSVERVKAITAERDGVTSHFCSRGCRAEFLGELPQAGFGQATVLTTRGQSISQRQASRRSK